jgi:hypothetical protein
MENIESQASFSLCIFGMQIILEPFFPYQLVYA